MLLIGLACGCVFQLSGGAVSFSLMHVEFVFCFAWLLGVRLVCSGGGARDSLAGFGFLYQMWQTYNFHNLVDCFVGGLFVDYRLFDTFNSSHLYVPL